MKKNRVLIVIVVVILAIIGSIAAVLITRYIKYKPIMGTYELVEGDQYSPLKLGLYKWSMGKKEDLKCNLYSCDGYKDGPIYYDKGNVIRFKFDNGYIEHPYKITTEGEDTYITFTLTSADGIVTINKYKKVK